MKKEHKIAIIIILLAILLLVGVGVFLKPKQTEVKVVKPFIGEKIEEMKSPHIKPGESHEPYNSNPPTSGPHIGDGVAGPGIKDVPVADELVVHSLEHGAAVVWYKEGLEKNEVDKIKRAFNNSSGKKIMLPRKGLDVPVVLTSWNYRLKLQTVDETKIKEFIETNNSRAPEVAPI